MSEDKRVDTRRLKAWAVKHLPRGSKLREVILLDEDKLTPEAYLAKLQVWLALYDLEHGFKEKQRSKQDMSETNKASEACQFCSTGKATSLDHTMQIYGCSCGRYWRNRDQGFYWLQRLSAAEASDKMASNNEQYKLEAEQPKNTNKHKEFVPPETLEKVKLDILEMMRRGECMAFLTAGGELIFAHIQDKAQTKPYSM